MLMASDITKCYTGRVGLGLDFDILYNAVQLINKTCPHSDLFFDHASDNVPRLTTTACEVIGQKGWCRYPNNEVWVRLSVHVWKLPLLQLVSQFSRPPLGLKGEVFAIVHLIGNPANTVFSLLKKLVRCQEISQRFRRRLRNGGIELALIVISYDELEVEEDNRAQDTILREYIDMRMWMNPDRSQRGWEWVRCERVASALAADRTTKFFPIVIALTLFVSALALALTRFSTSPPINSDPINVEAHSIAFSALYFYVITAVFLSSMIGVSQTEWAIPRILSDLEELAIVLPSRDNLTECRLLHGGLYSWQQWERYRNDSVLLALTFVSVAIGPLSSILISWYIKHLDIVVYTARRLGLPSLRIYRSDVTVRLERWARYSHWATVLVGIFKGPSLRSHESNISRPYSVGNLQFLHVLDAIWQGRLASTGGRCRLRNHKAAVQNSVPNSQTSD